MGAIRLFLALVVATDHWRFQVLSPAGIVTNDAIKLGFNSGYAVLFFYMISGFLITFTLTENYERDSAGVLKFYQNRFVRIFSLYWPVLIFSAYLSPLATRPGDLLTNIFLVGADWRLAFADYPALDWKALPDLAHPAWTLGAELTFYLIAPWLLRSWSAPIALLLASLAFRLGFILLHGPQLDDRWTYHFAGSTICFFMLGHLAARCSREWPILSHRLIGLAFFAASFGAMALMPFRAFDDPRLWVSVWCFAAALPGIFSATKDIRILNGLGDLSYTVYLTHIFTIGFFLTALTGAIPITSRVLSILTLLGTCVVVASICRLLVELPTARVMHAAFALAGSKGRPKGRPLAEPD